MVPWIFSDQWVFTLQSMYGEQKKDVDAMKTTTLSKTNSSPLNIGRNPKGKDRLPTIHFQGIC